MFRVLSRSFSFKLPGTIVSSSPSSSPKGFVKEVDVYQPKDQLKFDSTGCTLVYSVDYMKKVSVFFPFPWSLGTWATPGLGWLWYNDVLGVYNPLLGVLAYAALMPHCWYLWNLRSNINKIWLMRDGMWKVETAGIHQITTNYYIKPSLLTLLNKSKQVEKDPKQAELLSDDGKLIRHVRVKAENWIEFHEERDEQKLFISKHGEVHNPELLQAMLQGYKIDTSNHVVIRDPENQVYTL